MDGIAGISNDEIAFYIPGNKQKYIQRFERVEEGKWTFNFYAAIFGELWFSYQFLLLEFIMFCAIMIMAGSAIYIFFIYRYEDVYSTIIAIVITRYIFVIIKAIVFGLVGDRLLWKSIKKRIKRDKNISNSLNVVDRISLYIEASEKRVVFRGVAVVVCAGILVISHDNIIAYIVSKVLY